MQHTHPLVSHSYIQCSNGIKLQLYKIPMNQIATPPHSPYLTYPWHHTPIHQDSSVSNSLYIWTLCNTFLNCYKTHSPHLLCNTLLWIKLTMHHTNFPPHPHTPDCLCITRLCTGMPLYQTPTVHNSYASHSLSTTLPIHHYPSTSHAYIQRPFWILCSLYSLPIFLTGAVEYTDRFFTEG